MAELENIVRLCRKRQFDAIRLLRQLQLSERFKTVFGGTFADKVKQTDYPSEACHVFCDEWDKLGNNESIALIIDAARRTEADKGLADFIIENASSNADKSTQHQTLHRIGEFPTVIEAHFEPPIETDQVKSAIQELWLARQTGNLAIHGQNGVGKSTLLSQLMHDDSFLASLPGLETIIWFNFQGLVMEKGANLKPKHFLKAIGNLLRETGFIQGDLPVTFPHFLAKLGEDNVRFLLIMDDVLDRKLLEFALKMSSVIRCIAISNDKDCLGISEMDDFVSKEITLEPSISQVEQLFRFKYVLPKSILDDPDKMKPILELSYGLPSVANVIYKKFAKNPKIVEDTFEKLEKSLAKASIFDVFKKAFESLDEQSRRLYYAFLLLEPGQTLRVNFLAYVWQMGNLADAIIECERFLDLGLVRQVELDFSVQERGYVIHRYLHQIAYDDAVSQYFGTNLRDIRMRLVHDAPHSSSGKNDNILLLATKLGDNNRDLVKVVVENVETSTLMALAKMPGENGQNVFQVLDSGVRNCGDNYEQSWRCTHAFLTILNRLLVGGFENEVTKSVLNGRFPVDLTKKDKASMNLVMHGCIRGHLKAVEWLVRIVKFDLDDTDFDGTTAVMFASKWGHLEMVKFLAQEGANLELGDSEGTTSLMFSAKWGHLNVLQWLDGQMQSNKLEEQNKNGETALMFAAWKGHFDVVKWLVEVKNVDLMAKNGDGLTALRLAIDASERSTFLREERQQIIDLLNSKMNSEL